MTPAGKLIIITICPSGIRSLSKPLTGLRVLLIEDEYLIAMDVEQLCRDFGAADVIVMHSLDELNGAPPAFDVAILDIMLAGVSTLDFARRLYDKGVPFIFASGCGDPEETAAIFPDVAMVTKPYAGEDLIRAVAAAAKPSSP
jgi:DNA-binding response OmpR family regulator